MIKADKRAWAIAGAGAIAMIAVLTIRGPGLAGGPAEAVPPAALAGDGGQPSDFARLVAARTTVQQALNAPETVDFRDLRISSRSDKVVCGYVDTANGFGGRTGFRRFASGETTALEGRMSDAEFARVWSLLC